MLFGVSFLTFLLVIWAVLTTVLVLLLILRGVTAMHEEDQIYLSASQHQFEEEQARTVARLQRLSPYIKTLTAASIVLIVAIGAIWLHSGIVGRG